MMKENNGGLRRIPNNIDLERFRAPKEDYDERENGGEKIAGEIVPDVMHFKVYSGVVRHFKLKPSEANVVFVIWSLQQKTGWCYASQETIAAGCNISPQALSPIIKSLGGCGYLEKGSRSRFNTIQWRVGAEMEDYIKYIYKLIEQRKSKRH